MSIWLVKEELERVKLPDQHYERTPVPTQIVSNGEYTPIPQTPQQRQVVSRINELSDEISEKHGLSRRKFLKTGSGMAVAFMAMNNVYGNYFEVGSEETRDLLAAKARLDVYKDQFIFDDQLHFVSDEFENTGILNLREFAAQMWNPAIKDKFDDFAYVQFENFIKEVYFDSDTTIGLLSGAPSDKIKDWFLSNEELAKTRQLVNEAAGTKRLYAHFVITPGQEGWIESIEQAIEELKPDSWKGYTIGDPMSLSEYPWRMDDENLIYPAYEIMEKAGIRNVCIHKGLLPNNYEQMMPGIWKYATVDDVGPAARDFPNLNFVIYHSGLQPFFQPEQELAKFEETGRINWVSDLAEIREKYGVDNVYAELGSTFGSSCITHPRFAAAILGILIKGLGHDHVIWGTDSVWYGSPQWQLEAFRRIEIPSDMIEKFGFSPLGAGNGEIKSTILGHNAAQLYDLPPELTAVSYYADDQLAKAKAKYQQDGGEPSNMVYGFIYNE